MAVEAIKIDADGGVSVASFREIRESLAKDFRTIFGDSEENKIDLSPSTPDGMLLDLFAFAYSAIAEHLQTVVQGMNPATASGIFLDYLAKITVGGRNAGETDEELRDRILTADHYGFATYDGMLTYLRAKIATGVTLRENPEDETADGLPPHSFEVFVPESATKTADEIAQAIWYCKPAGIKAAGSSEGTAKDAAGMTQPVRYSKVEKQTFLAKIEITEYEEEELPEDYADRIRAAVAEWAAGEYTPGKDIIPQRITVPVYGITGIESVAVTVSTDGGKTWSGARQPVAAGSYACLPAENVTVTPEDL